MRKLTKKALSGTLWMARGTATMVGFAVMLALVVGLASAALAGTGVGARFDLGKANAVDAVSRLVGSVAGPQLLVDNRSTATGATALRLGVEPGRPPLVVDPAAGTAANLSADELDGKGSAAFFSGKTYVASELQLGPGGGVTKDMAIFCDEGDKALGGGGFGTVLGDDLQGSLPRPPDGWVVRIQDNNSPSNLIVEAVCADFPPLRP